MSLNPKERLVRKLNKKKTDRPPVICTGGMMNAAIVDIMKESGHVLPKAHSDGQLMAELAADIYSHTGFENVGVPFCMTTEAEVLGSDIDIGSLACEPKIAKEKYASAAAVRPQQIDTLLKSGRINTVIQATYHLSRRFPDVPVIGNLTGPISTTASVVDPMALLKDLRRSRKEAHQAIEYVTGFLIAYAKLMIDNGASIISIGDPTATGEILGPRMFEEYPLFYINHIVDAIHAEGVPVIVHICGNMHAVKHLLPKMKADAISTDAMVNLRQLKEEFPQIVTMGNVSTYLLELGTADKVASVTKQLVREGIDIISPACGLSTSTGLKNIQALSGVVKES